MALSIGCSRGSSSEELEALKAENALLRAQLEELAKKPVGAEEPLGASSEPNTDAGSAIGQGAGLAPTPSPDDAPKKTFNLDGVRKKSTFKANDEVTFKSIRVFSANEWKADRQNNSFYVSKADKGSTFLIVEFEAHAKSKDPSLPVIALYAGDDMTPMGRLRLRFHRWDDYGSYLGNYSDFGNDFAKRDKVKFSAAYEVPKERLTEKIVLAASKAGCLVRTFERFSRPALRYEADQCPDTSDYESFTPFWQQKGVKPKKSKGYGKSCSDAFDCPGALGCENGRCR